MNKKKKILLCSIITLVIALSVGGAALAANGYDIKSHGRIVFDNGTEDTSDDVVFDADDLATIESDVVNGKLLLSTTINAATAGHTEMMDDGVTPVATSLSESADNVPTFDEINDSIANVKKAGNKEGYDIGYTEGLAKALSANHIEYTYHTHSSSCNCTGRYTWTNGDYYVTREHAWQYSGEWYDKTHYRHRCNKCGNIIESDYENDSSIVGRVCGRQTCGKTTSTIEGATITMN